MSEKNSKPKIQWVVALGAAAAWFGQQAGAGFASGLQTITYFTNAGWLSLITTLVPMTILGFVFYFMGEYAREIKATSYKDVATTLYSDNKAVGKAVLTLFDLIIMGSVLITSSTTIAGAGTLMEKTFGMNYLLATIIFTILIVVISMFGARFLAAISLPLCAAMVVMLLIIGVLLIGNNWDSLQQVVASKETFGVSTGTAIKNMLYYTGLQTGFIGAYIAIAGSFGSKNDNKVMAITGGVANTVMLALLSCAVLSRMPGIATSKIPILDMTNELFGNGSILSWFYTISLFIAYISTGDVVAATSRFGTLINRNNKYNQILVDAILGAILLCGSLLMAQLGITVLVDKGYKFLALLRGPLYIAGGLVFAPYKLHQIRKKRASKAAVEA